MTAEPNWLPWTRELQAIAQTGLTYARDAYDRERYERIRSLASEIMGAYAGIEAKRVATLFAGETGYATPKLDVRGATFDAQGRLLLVRETADAGRWALPGGWADVNLTPAECIAKEIREESGLEVSVRKLAAVWDRTRQGHSSKAFSCWKLFFICDVIGGTEQISLETSAVAWFERQSIPDDLSTDRVLHDQLERMFVHAQDPHLATDFD